VIYRRLLEELGLENAEPLMRGVMLGVYALALGMLLAMAFLVGRRL
jgi:hypothetical protein